MYPYSNPMIKSINQNKEFSNSKIVSREGSNQI